MKKLCLLSLLICVGVFSKMQAQNLKNDCEFLKSTTLIYHAISLFDEAKDGETADILSSLKKDVDKINAIHKSLSAKYPNDKDLKVFTMWVDVTQKSYSLLKEDDNTWQLAYSLLKLDLKDFINESY